MEQTKQRKCFECDKPLKIDDFCYVNLFSIGDGLKLWNNAKLEFYCCSCFKSKRFLPLVNSKKIIITGSPFSGKTSIVNFLSESSLFNVFALHSSRSKTIQIFETNTINFFIWKLAGTQYDIRQWTKNQIKYLFGTLELIYVIDIIEESQFNISIQYLSNLVKTFEIIKSKEMLPEIFKITILFHKANLDKINTSNLRKNIEILNQKVKILSIPFRFEIIETTLDMKNSVNGTYEYSEFSSYIKKVLGNKDIL